MFSCKEENDKPFIDPELTEYVNAFVEEARLRGQIISSDNIEAKFGTLTEKCGLGSPNPPRVSIDRNCWDGTPELPRELLMFHELGHAVLGRSHELSKLPNGDFASIMCTEPRILYNEYTIEKRAYYLDELFNTFANFPDWAAEKTTASIVLMDEVTRNGAWEYVRSGTPNHSGSVADSLFSSASQSLMIESAGPSDGFSFWAYAWTPDNIETGSALELKVKIKGNDLTNGGAFFALRADVHGEEHPVFFFTTQGTPVRGNTDGFRAFPCQTKDRLMRFYRQAGIKCGYSNNLKLGLRNPFREG
jgi:hypothetical protein